MRQQLTFLILLALSACNTKNSFDQVDCMAPQTISENVVYKPCRQFIFRARLWHSEGTLISDEKIWIMNSGKPWETDSQQNEALIQYRFNPSKIDYMESFGINESFNMDWIESTNTGYIENDEQVWFHPFRQNQYYFTEVAPFPNIMFDSLSVGKSWEAGPLHIHQGWGDWNESEIDLFYQVTEVTAIETEFRNFENTFHINAVADADFGASTLDSWFDKEYGFVRLLYINYANQTLDIELIDVIEP